jgi:hypothetical protein
MLVEILDGIDEISIERHAPDLCDLERREQPGGAPVVGECPSQRWCHPVGVKGTQRIPFAGADGCHQIRQPHRSVPIVERHDRRAGATATNAGFNHVQNLDGEPGENKDLAASS